MILRSAASLFLLLLCVSARPQTLSQTDSQAAPSAGGSESAAPINPNVPRAFKVPSLDVTYFYPGRFTPVIPSTGAAAAEKCVQSNLSGSSISPVGTSVFVLSTIDATCPQILRGASQELGAFTREQILRQLKQYGDPEITQDSTRYVIDGHPAAITFASVEHPDTANRNGILPPKVTYAAKACILGNVPAKHSKTPGSDTSHILCFDFTTQQRDLLPLMLAFSMQFEGHSPTPLVPGSVLR
jgi:hypothetical protein